MTGRGGGTGSPVWFRCFRARRTRYHPTEYGVKLTGRTRPYHAPRAPGVRSVLTSYEYECDACGYVGWSNHVDLARQAGDEDAMKRRGYRL